MRGLRGGLGGLSAVGDGLKPRGDNMKAVSLLKKELGQKDRLLLQNQAKLEEALRKLSEASYQQVGTGFHH